MKILHVTASLSPNYGGPAHVVRELTESLAENGNQVTIYTLDAFEEKGANANKYLIKGVEVKRFRTNKMMSFGHSFELFRELKKNIKNFDIVHVHSIYYAYGIMVRKLCKKYKIPYIITPHGSLNSYIYQRKKIKKRLYEFMFENKNMNDSQALHFTAAEESMQANGYAKKCNKIVIPNGLKLSDYLIPSHFDKTIKTKFPSTGDKQIILFLGRITPVKGLDILIDAFEMLLKENNNTHLIIAGPDQGNYKKVLLNLCHKKNILNNVTFTGILNSVEKLYFLKESDLLVLPSYSENFGMVAIEALACRTPIIISDQVNIWREIEENGAGVITKCDSTELKTAILTLISNEEKKKEISENGFLLVNEIYNWKKISKNYLFEYDKIIKNFNSEVNNA